MDKKVYLGKQELNFKKNEVKGFYTELDGEDYFKIENFDQMRPFFMTIVSSTDHWLFISSYGALSAGRGNSDRSIFPYYTDDKIIDSQGITGSKSILRIHLDDKIYLWEPFAWKGIEAYDVSRSIYKNREGSRIIFEEINHDLGLCFRYGWMFTEEYGIVKRSEIFNQSEDSVMIEILDGATNILPYGVDSKLQNERSTLVDAYKRSELDSSSNLAIYSLSSKIIDTAEPSESLRANSTWSCGIEVSDILLSDLQLADFIADGKVLQETDIKAEKGAFFLRAELNLEKDSSRRWYTVFEVGQDINSLERLKKDLNDRASVFKKIESGISEDKASLRRKIGLADGIQLSNDRLSTGRHFSNVLFNIMRGGNFDDQYTIDTADFISHVKNLNREVFKQYQNILDALPKSVSYHQLRHFIEASGQEQFLRYFLEYLPLTFSRRHGDPSRPWNHFSIELKDEKGNKLRNFEGNWRDIFQNWEALLFSYPEFAPAMITKFSNASTIDGYNPYRISREGIDWEIEEPDDPWSYIGYWGDHQVIYLTKFLEFSFDHHPRRLNELLESEIFTYANVPYRIKGYDSILSDPKDTIVYDRSLADEIGLRVEKIGAEGKMVVNRFGELEKVNLTEKLLVSLLTKLYNFVPDGGIWLNTQRPEWNDANNALVGNGLSMVTLYYLRRMLKFLGKLFEENRGQQYTINKAVIDLMEALRKGFERHESSLEKGFNKVSRRDFMDDFGIAGEHFRTTAYAGFTGDKRTIGVDRLISFFELANKYLEVSIDGNKREDQLFHSYNLIDIQEGTASVSPLYEMLEGQVAALSSKYLDQNTTVELCAALKSSKMFRPDQYSYMLYPDRELDGFLSKNTIEPSIIKKSDLLSLMQKNGTKDIVEMDINGKLHFNANFKNERDLLNALNNLDDLVERKLALKEIELWKECFEHVFDHHSFTGRSGTFFGYEGLGSIYWHMVSKLLLSIQENITRAYKEQWEEWAIDRLIEHYYEIRAGIGINKSPDLYGAFPTDAYSHTPKGSGAKQPGMTGQVKEDIINRWVELGLEIKEGRIYLDPKLLRKDEFLSETAQLSYYDVNGKRLELNVDANGMAFTYCQIPIEYRISDQKNLILEFADGNTKENDELVINKLDSKSIFQRDGKIIGLKVYFEESDLI